MRLPSLTPVRSHDCGSAADVSALAGRRPVSALASRADLAAARASSLAAAVVVLHGLVGPDLAPGNLATVLTWVHYRGLLVVALLAAGNFFCAGCPFVLVRDWGRRLHAPTRMWPTRLRGKWIAIVLFVGGAVRVRALRSLGAAAGHGVPGAGVFRRGARRRLSSSRARRSASICARSGSSTSWPRRCRRSSCRFGAGDVSGVPHVGLHFRTAIAGAGTAPQDVIVQRGCELGLFLPAKVGNLDCTFCLDCVQACPHDNIALAVRAPALELVDGRRRSGIGRLARRPDIAVLAVLFVFGAHAQCVCDGGARPSRGAVAGGDARQHVRNARARMSLRSRAGRRPLLLLGAAAILTRAMTRDSPAPVGRVAMRYAYGLVPFGFGMWLAHYGFHLLTGALTVVPVTQSAAIDLLGWPALGDPLWRWAGMRPGAVLPLQLGCILLGTAGSVARHAPHLSARLPRPAQSCRPAVGRPRDSPGCGRSLGAVPADGDERDEDRRVKTAASARATALALICVLDSCRCPGAGSYRPAVPDRHEPHHRLV